MSDIHLVVLAAGKGTRMKSGLPKVLHEAAGLPLIEYALRAGDSLGPASTTVVVGHLADRVQALLDRVVDEAAGVDHHQVGTRVALAGAVALGAQLREDALGIDERLRTT